MSLHNIAVSALLSVSNLAAADPWVLHFGDPQDSSKVNVVVFDVWDEDGNMHPRLPETFNRTQCLYVSDLLSRSSKLAYPDNPDQGKYGCTPGDD